MCCSALCSLFTGSENRFAHLLSRASTCRRRHWPLYSSQHGLSETLGELGGVADQVDEQLPPAHGVADDEEISAAPLAALGVHQHLDEGGAAQGGFCSSTSLPCSSLPWHARTRKPAHSAGAPGFCWARSCWPARASTCCCCLRMSAPATPPRSTQRPRQRLLQLRQGQRLRWRLRRHLLRRQRLR